MSGFLKKLREKSADRTIEIVNKFNGGNNYTIDDRVTKLHEETGELLVELVAYIKSNNTEEKEHILSLIKEELADVIITGGLLLQEDNELLENIIASKFNKTSDKLKLNTRIENNA
jgi:NTP pyrophosphatase (non-canonical NTP hydrolase)